MGPLSRASDLLFRTRLLRPAALCVGLASTLAACGGVTPPPRFSAVSPADAGAPEAPAAPAAPLLSGDRPAIPPPPTPPAIEPAPSAPPAPLTRGTAARPGAASAGAGIGVRGGFRAEAAKDAPAPAVSGTPSPASEKQTSYSCPMHPLVVAQAPGACSSCGMRLVRTDTKAGASKP